MDAPLTEADKKRAFNEERRRYWSDELSAYPQGRPMSRYYRRRLTGVFRQIVPPGRRVLEIGCGAGRLLAALQPAYGVGVDFSEQAVETARRDRPHLEFMLADAHDFDVSETFDFIILSDLINELWDVQAVLRRVRKLCAPHGRVVINSYSRLWQLPLALAKRLRLAAPVLDQNWLTPDVIRAMLALEGFDVVRRRSEILCPVAIPIVSRLCNRWLVKLWPFRVAALTNVFVARPIPSEQTAEHRNPPLVSVIVPARNEAGNVEQIFERTPEMGAGTELVFVEGGSSDNTAETIEAEVQRHPERRARLLRQTGRGKGDAVRLGFSKAKGDVLMILDADATVPPESLPRFYEAIAEGRADFVNGARLVYPMEKGAMRFFNILGNKFFSLLFTWLLDQPVHDTLCGTKAMRKRDYERIAENRLYFGDFDPFGDFDLLFGAAKLNLKIVDMPVRYRERTYGETQIRRWRHGLMLLRMAAFAARKIKFI